MYNDRGTMDNTTAVVVWLR